MKYVGNEFFKLIFGRAESSLLCTGFLQLQHVGFSLWRLSCREAHAHALGTWLSSCDAQALLLLSICSLPGPGVKLMSPALAGGFQPLDPQGSPG